MDEYFIEYYQIVDPTPDETRLNKRWTGVERFLKGTTPAKGIDLIRLFYGSSPHQIKFLEEFKDAFRQADKVFPPRNNELELQVLAGVCLKELVLEEDADLANLIALGAVCAAGCGMARRPAVPAILSVSAKRLAENSENRRQHRDLSRAKTVDFHKQYAEKIKTLATGETAPLANFFQEISKYLNQTAETHHAYQLDFNERLCLQEEETNILWWVFGQSSRDLDTPIRNIKPAALVCILLGKELADLTQIIPGPLGAKAFLDRMLSLVEPKPQGEISIQDAVNALPRDWRKQLTEHPGFEQISDICPVFTAISHSLTTEGDSDWLPPFEKSSGISRETKLVALDFAYQSYLECLLLKAANNMKLK